MGTRFFSSFGPGNYGFETLIDRDRVSLTLSHSIILGSRSCATSSSMVVLADLSFGCRSFLESVLTNSNYDHPFSMWRFWAGEAQNGLFCSPSPLNRAYKSPLTLSIGIGRKIEEGIIMCAWVCLRELWVLITRIWEEDYSWASCLLLWWSPLTLCSVFNF